jgi:zinc finger protein
MEKLPGQECPTCREKALTLMQDELDIPFFGKVFLFGMQCDSCGFKKSDLEAAEMKDPCKYEIEITEKDDLNIRVVKSSHATVKWPDFKITIEPGVSAQGFVANIDWMLNDLQDIQKVLEFNKETEEDKPKKKRMRKMIDKILDIKDGKEKAKLIIEDPTGNSAIISDKATKSALKKTKPKSKKK